MSGKSKEEIAFEILSKLKGVGIWGENNQSDILDMYANCLEATSGMREVDGRTPIAVRIAEKASTVTPIAAPAPAAAATPPVLAMRQAAPAQAPVPQQPLVQQPIVRQPQQVAPAAYQQQRPQ